MRDQAHQMTEAELKAIVIDMAIAKGWLVHQTPQIKPRRPARRKGASGYPDLTLARDGVVLWPEIKDEHGRLSDAQAYWQLHLPAMEVIRPSDLARGRVDELLA